MNENKNDKYIFKPVLDAKNNIQLLDMYLGEIKKENWLGSRGSYRACLRALGLLDAPKV